MEGYRTKKKGELVAIHNEEVKVKVPCRRSEGLHYSCMANITFRPLYPQERTSVYISGRYNLYTKKHIDAYVLVSNELYTHAPI